MSRLVWVCVVAAWAAAMGSSCRVSERPDPSPQPEVVPRGVPPLGEEPGIVTKSAKPTEDLRRILGEAAQDPRNWDRSTVGGEIPIPLPTTPRGLAPDLPSEIGGEPRADLTGSEVEGCDGVPYLAVVDEGEPVFRDGRLFYDSFEWWDKAGDVPLSGPIATPFECEFNQPLVRISGADVSGLQDITEDRGERWVRGYKWVTNWGASTNWTTPNLVPYLNFTARRHTPGPDGMQSDPQLETLRVIGSDGRRRNRVVLVNRGFPEDPYNVHIEGNRPSLFLDFDKPQRAVGLEFGYLTLEELGVDIEDLGRRQPRMQDIWLIAYDEHGEVLEDQNAPIQSQPVEFLLGETRLDRYDVTRRIGVRDRRARIRSVELRFGQFQPGDEGDGQIIEPQVVYRVWAEPLPHAAVQQGRLDTTYTLGQRNAETKQIELPYDCDRAVAFLRGFMARYDDGRPRPFGNLELRFDGAMDEFRTEPGGTIELSATGGLTEDGDEGRHLTLYYTLLAWDSRLSDVYTVPLGGMDTAVTIPVIRTQWTWPDPRCAASGGWCGDLFPAVQRVQMGVSSSNFIMDQLDYLWFSAGTSAGQPGVLGGFFWDAPLLNWATGQLQHRYEYLGRDGTGNVEFNASSGLREEWDDGWIWEGGRPNTRHTRLLEAVALTGTGVTVAEQTRQMGFNPLRDRVDGDFPVSAQLVRDYGFAPRVTGDVAFLGMSGMIFTPKDRIGPMEVEFEGVAYDGRTVDWRMATASNSGSVLATTVIGTVQRNDYAWRPRVDVRPLSVESVVGLRRAGRDVGSVTNVGFRPLLVDDVNLPPSLPSQSSPFEVFFQWGGQMLSLEEFRAQLPLTLVQGGQSILVGVTYEPTAPAGFDGLPPDRTFVRFTTNHPTRRNISLPIHGFAREPDVSAHWLPGTMDFGSLGAAVAPATGHALLVSSGTTPLVFEGFRFGDGNKGFSNARLGPRVESDVMVVFVDWAGHARAGEIGFLAEDVLIADTSAGPIELRLVAGGLRQVSPWENTGGFPGPDEESVE